MALKFAMNSHFPLPKKFALFVPTLSRGAIVLPIEKMNQKLSEIEKEIVREVARGDKPSLRKSADRKAQISPLN